MTNSINPEKERIFVAAVDEAEERAKKRFQDESQDSESQSDKKSDQKIKRVLKKENILDALKSVSGRKSSFSKENFVLNREALRNMEIDFALEILGFVRYGVKKALLPDIGGLLRNAFFFPKKVRAVSVKLKDRTIRVRGDLKGHAIKLFKAIEASTPPKLLKII